MPKPNQYTDLTGKIYGELTVLKLAEPRFDSRGWKIYCWHVRCSCGTEFVSPGAPLKNGGTKRCWSCRSEKIRQDHLGHGHARKNGRSPEYSSWIHAKARCFNKNSTSFHYYGGRGITMHPEWVESFQAFLEYIGPCPTKDHTLDRWPDVNGDYAPGNVRWATREEQSNNKRLVTLHEWSGGKYSIAQISRLADVNACALSKRVKKGMSVASAVIQLQAMRRLARCRRKTKK